jgi:protein-disulfide isomerase
VTRRLAMSACLVALWVVACSAQPEPTTPASLTLDPVMSKGPASAPVTIVEFSDYQ